jgi:hypothetical protein
MVIRTRSLATVVARDVEACLGRHDICNRRSSASRIACLFRLGSGGRIVRPQPA